MDPHPHTLDLEGVGGAMRSVVAFTAVAIVLRGDDSGPMGPVLARRGVFARPGAAAEIPHANPVWIR